MCVNLRSYLWDFESHPTSNTDAFRTTRTTFSPKVLIFDEFGIRLKNKLLQLGALSTWGEVHQHWLLVWPETQTAVCWVKVLCLTRPFSQMSDPFGPLLLSKWPWEITSTQIWVIISCLHSNRKEFYSYLLLCSPEFLRTVHSLSTYSLEKKVNWVNCVVQVRENTHSVNKTKYISNPNPSVINNWI